MRTQFKGIELLFLFIAFTQSASAAPWHCTLDALRELLPSGLDSSVELELDASPEVLRLLTTTDGKVSGLLKEGEVLPSWFLKFAQSKFENAINPAQIQWDALEFDTQLRLVRDLSAQRGQSFFSNRKVHGLVTRQTLTLEFTQNTIFLGKNYPAGSHTVDVSSVLARKVEYSGPDDIKSFGGVELHFRSPQTSGVTSNDAWTLLEGLRIPRNHQHVHVLAPLNVDDFKPNREVHAALMGDFFRRANLAAEMVTIVHERGSIATEGYEGVTYFDSVSLANISGVTQYLLDFGRGNPPKIGARYKMGWVGMRGTDTYDQPGLWGLEVRSISSSTHPDVARGLLNGIQQSMNSRTFGITPEKLSRWLSNTPESRIAGRMSDAWYGQEVGNLFDRAPNLIRARLGKEQAFIKSKDKILDAMTGRKEVKMLLFDWSRDPLVFENPALQEKILAEQIQALDRILSVDEPDVNEIVSDFLIRSGLYQEVMNSLGVKAQVNPR